MSAASTETTAQPPSGSAGTTHRQSPGFHLPCPNAHLVHGQASLCGSRYGILNQDVVLTHEMHDFKHLQRKAWPQCYLTIVLDGHGMLGEQAAQEAGQCILRYLEHSKLRHCQLSEMDHTELEHLLKQAFAAGHTAALRVYDRAPATYTFPLGNELEQRYTLQKQEHGDKVYYAPRVGGRMLEFGTSATVALVQGTTLVIADVGDSLAVLGWEEGDSYKGEIVSVRHNGWTEGEAARIARECGPAVTISPDDGYLCVQVGRMAGFQLAMTRALGHRLLSQYGVSHEPSVVFHQLRAEHVCVILATDGVWEVLSPGAAVKVVADVMAGGRSADEAAHELCTTAVQVAVAHTCVRQPGGEADNTTASVFVFCEL